MSRENILLWKIYYLGKCAKPDNISNRRKIPEVLLKVKRCI